LSEMRKNFQFMDYTKYNDKIAADITDLHINDHATGFLDNGSNKILDRLDDRQLTVWTQYIVNDQIKTRYPNLTFNLDIDLPKSTLMLPTELEPVGQQRFAPKKDFKNFVFSLNGNNNITRQLLISALYKFGWFDPDYGSKHFIFTRADVDGKINHYCGSAERFYRKFFLSDEPEFDQFLSTRFGIQYRSHEHAHNMQVLAHSIAQSFVQIVSETSGSCGYPFVTEKFVYPILARTLWVSYAQPGWHNYVETYYGFRKHQIFDYSFDLITNPVERVIALLSMLSKFKYLSQFDWHDLYLLEQDTIEYNYDWYFSRGYLKNLKTISEEMNVCQ